MIKTTHPWFPRTRRRFATVTVGSFVVAAGGVLAPFAVPASAGVVAPPVPTATVGQQLPGVGGTGDGSCFESADTGWVCAPDGISYNASTDTYVEVLAPPPDATLIDPVPDPNAPTEDPTDTWVETDPTIPSGAGSLTCQSYGTATWLRPPDGTCPPAHWYNAYFYVHDGTGSAWPVQAKASYWNASAVDVGYGCHTNYHCVPVVDGRYGATGWVGLTTWKVDQYHRFIGVSVKFNDSYSTTAAEKAEAVCHELGHVTGLGHETSNVSCLNSVADGTHQFASNDDFDQLGYHTYNGAT